MSLDTLIFLLRFDWPFVLVVLAVGCVTGWVSASPPSRREQKGRGG